MADVLLIIKGYQKHKLAGILSATGHKVCLAEGLSAAVQLTKTKRDLDVVILDRQPANQEENDLRLVLQWRLRYAKWLFLASLPNPLSKEELVEAVSLAWNKARQIKERKQPIDAAL